MELSRGDLAEYTKTFVHELPPVGERAHVVGLKGDLGAGKTTFVQEVAKVLGVKENVTSPTFVLVQTYKTTHPAFTHLVHIDAYRLHNEVKDTIGFSEYYKDPHNLILVEWPLHLPEGFPENAPILAFETVGEDTRRIFEISPG